MNYGDLLRSMSNEELAVRIMCPNDTGLAVIPCSADNCRKCTLDWLNKEVKE
jgi:hypothetical protein